MLTPAIEKFQFSTHSSFHLINVPLVKYGKICSPRKLSDGTCPVAYTKHSFRLKPNGSQSSMKKFNSVKAIQ